MLTVHRVCRLVKKNPQYSMKLVLYSREDDDMVIETRVECKVISLSISLDCYEKITGNKGNKVRYVTFGISCNCQNIWQIVHSVRSTKNVYGSGHPTWIIERTSKAAFNTQLLFQLNQEIFPIVPTSTLPKPLPR